ncbi:MAG: LuxR family transcriptional regulator [Rickettsiaceae bacterium]|nr:MAG: LuxR family transcriptional regulator [Rickettsiaceae bacterium]
MDSITSSVQPVLDLISESLKYYNQQDHVLSNSTILSLWGNEKLSNRKMSNIGKGNRRKTVKLIYKEKEIFLSAQEQKCFLLLKLGWSNKSIAIKLNLSELTVKDHIAHLKRKFAVQSRDNLTEIAQLKTMQHVQLTEIS